jgi:hypothetical protein
LPVETPKENVVDEASILFTTQMLADHIITQSVKEIIAERAGSPTYAAEVLAEHIIAQAVTELAVEDAYVIAQAAAEPLVEEELAFDDIPDIQRTLTAHSAAHSSQHYNEGRHHATEELQRKVTGMLRNTIMDSDEKLSQRSVASHDSNEQLHADDEEPKVAEQELTRNEFVHREPEIVEEIDALLPLSSEEQAEAADSAEGVRRSASLSVKNVTRSKSSKRNTISGPFEMDENTDISFTELLISENSRLNQEITALRLQVAQEQAKCEQFRILKEAAEARFEQLARLAHRKLVQAQADRV